MTHRFALVGALATLTGGISAQAEEPLVKDLRKEGSPSSLSVVICARPGIPGHAMVILGKDDEARQACTVEALGFYPTNPGKAVMGPVPGRLADEFIQGKGVAEAACRIIIRVDPAQFGEVDRIRQRWSSKHDYQLLEADCVTFTDEVVRSLGLKTPARADAKLPTTYIREVYRLNR